MGKILKYELRRLLLNKFFIGLLAINGLFAWYTLTSDTIAGVAYTAPFSPWSFAAYLASVMPLSILTVLFLLTFFHSKNEKRVELLTATTPMNAVHFALIRVTAVVLGLLIIMLLVVCLNFCFCAAFFGFRHYAAFVAPAIVTVLPCFVFVVGLGYWAGHKHPGLLYALMLLSLVMNFVRVPGAFDFYGGGYYASSPLSLPPGADGEPAFMLSPAFLAARAFYLVVGGILLVVSIRRNRRKTD